MFQFLVLKQALNKDSEVQGAVLQRPHAASPPLHQKYQMSLISSTKKEGKIAAALKATGEAPFSWNTSQELQPTTGRALKCSQGSLKLFRKHTQPFNTC